MGNANVITLHQVEQQVLKSAAMLVQGLLAKNT
jgi:hypothetical protein